MERSRRRRLYRRNAVVFRQYTPSPGDEEVPVEEIEQMDVDLRWESHSNPAASVVEETSENSESYSSFSTDDIYPLKPQDYLVLYQQQFRQSQPPTMPRRVKSVDNPRQKPSKFVTIPISPVQRRRFDRKKGSKKTEMPDKLPMA